MNVFKKIKKIKKGISPVVATALLLVVAVVAVVGFQNWFTTFQSTQLVDVQVQTSSVASGGSVEVLNVIGEEIYFKNSKSTQVELNELRLNDVVCPPFNISSGVSKYNIKSCLDNVSESKVSIVVAFDERVFEKDIYYEKKSEPAAPADSTPDAFSFSSYMAMGWDTAQSDTVTVTGFDGSLTVNIFSEEDDEVLRVNGGTWVTTSQISAGDTLQIQVTSTTCMKNADVNVTVGDFSTIWQYNEAC